MTGRRAQRGFSLVELLVAMAVTALIGALAWQFVDVAVDTTEDTRRVLDRTGELESLWAVLSMDLRQAVDGHKESDMSMGLAVERSDGFVGNPAGLPAGRTDRILLRFVRGGWANLQGQQRSELQRVTYRLREGALWRESGALRNLPAESRPVPVGRVLLDDVTRVDIRFLPVDAPALESGWLPSWPPADGRMAVQGDAGLEEEDDGSPGRTLPLAVEVTIVVEQTGEVQRIFLLPGR